MHVASQPATTWALATGVTFTDPDVAGAVVVPNTLKVSPIAFNDNYTGTIVRDPKGEAMGKLKLNLLPVSVLLGKDGSMRRSIGAPEPDMLRQWLS